MGITESDLLFKYTNNATTVNPELSLGGTLSPNTIPSGVDNNLFDDVTGDESSLGAQHYRAIGIHNTLTTHIWMNTKAWITGYNRAASNYDVIFFGTERPSGTGGTPDGTIQTIPDEYTEPTGITWIEEGSPSDTVDVSGNDYVGSIGPDDWAGFWFQRSVPAGAVAFSNRSCTLRVEGETSASPYIYQLAVEFKITWDEKGFSFEKIFEENKIIGKIG